MTILRFACCDERRRDAIAGHLALNAIDYIEVGDLHPEDLPDDECPEYDSLPQRQRARLLWQRRLTVHFVNPLTHDQQSALVSDKIRIAGGERIAGIRVDVLRVGRRAATLRSSRAGDYSRYWLALVRSSDDERVPPGFDPILSRIAFSYKVNCPSDFDCKDVHVCLRPPVDEPEIDYLAKDYPTFRRLLLDRLSLLVPAWRDRSPADLGVALVELLAYVGDYLSYQQDAIATEAYLETARRRSSIRRHARLVDYAMHDGCNARAWVHARVTADATVLPADIQFATAIDGLPPRIQPQSPDETSARNADAEWFEPLGPDLDPASATPIDLRADHNELRFYTWGDAECCLPRRATRATLRGHHPALQKGMALVFEEVKGPMTGEPSDADPGHRHVVHLTSVVHTEDGARLVDPLDQTEITGIAWGEADAPSFPICISARIGQRAVADVSVARGNLVLVDHGQTITDEPLGTAPSPTLAIAEPTVDRCKPRPTAVPARFRPSLRRGPLTATTTVRKTSVTSAGTQTRWVRFDPDDSAAAVIAGRVGDARPAIWLESEQADKTRTPWTAVPDLLDSAADAAEFVVETEHDGTATLRFGGNGNGRHPRTEESFVAAYRVGNGTRGNVGADAIRHVITADARIVEVRNPLPARGGQNPESVEVVRRHAPQAFRTQERAVTPVDYEEMTARHAGVQRAAATLRWTGSWHTVFLAVDRVEGHTLDEAFAHDLRRHLDRYRMAGHDLEFNNPLLVALEIELAVCVAPDYFRSDVKRRLLDVLSNRTLPDGRQGLFHPDTFSFGQTVYLSPVLAAAHDVPGVASASATIFRRQDRPSTVPLIEGRLRLDRLEIARLDNDPDFPEHGLLRLVMNGGK